jgi:cytochrome c oxidase cbb3-type subunit 4
LTPKSRNLLQTVKGVNKTQTMKLRNYLESISGVGIFPVITLLIFFGFFTALSVWAIRARKEHLSAMNNLPLEDTEVSNYTQQA